jgi:hypothetical protein
MPSELWTASSQLTPGGSVKIRANFQLITSNILSGDVMAELRAALDEDKVLAAAAGVGAEGVLARLQREFFEG